MESVQNGEDLDSFATTDGAKSTLR